MSTHGRVTFGSGAIGLATWTRCAAGASGCGWSTAPAPRSRPSSMSTPLDQALADTLVTLLDQCGER
jgi:hypothetical protein